MVVIRIAFTYRYSSMITFNRIEQKQETEEDNLYKIPEHIKVNNVLSLYALFMLSL